MQTVTYIADPDKPRAQLIVGASALRVRPFPGAPWTPGRQGGGYPVRVHELSRFRAKLSEFVLWSPEIQAVDPSHVFWLEQVQPEVFDNSLGRLVAPRYVTSAGAFVFHVDTWEKGEKACVRPGELAGPAPAPYAWHSLTGTGWGMVFPRRPTCRGVRIVNDGVDRLFVSFGPRPLTPPPGWVYRDFVTLQIGGDVSCEISAGTPIFLRAETARDGHDIEGGQWDDDGTPTDPTGWTTIHES